ncbi:MMPL family transporter [Virgibacillus sp. DJP39]|uniref:MMPL family transporter n=1 Tax=Virgibacillus sp. DJP39 TaxID=3409790 RepID=UPI003BB67659
MFILKRLFQLLKKNPLKTMLMTALLIAILAIGVQDVKMATGNDTLVSSESDVYQENLALEREFGGESIVVMYESVDQKELLTIDNFEHMERLQQELEENQTIYSIISPVMLVNKIAENQEENYQKGLSKVIYSLDAIGGKINRIEDSQLANESSIGLQEMHDQLGSISKKLDNMQKYSDYLSPGLPQTQKSLNHMIYDDNGELQDMFNKLIMDGKYMMMSITFKAKASDEDKSETIASIKDYFDQYSLTTTETFVSGKPVLDGAIRTSMQASMKKMMILAIGIMIIVLTLAFKTRWRLLPLGIILVAVAGTVGFMGWVNISITMVSMAVFPILIGLGIDYGIQFQSRYTEEMEGSENHYEE